MTKLLIVHIKVLKSNIFLIISNSLGKIVQVKNSGELGFRNIGKNSLEVLEEMLSEVVNYFSRKKVSNVFFKIEGVRSEILDEIYKWFMLHLKKIKVQVLGFKIINKIGHNGCRKKK